MGSPNELTKCSFWDVASERLPKGFPGGPKGAPATFLHSFWSPNCAGIATTPSARTKKHTSNNLEMESASAFTKCLFVGCGLLKGLPGGPKPPRSPILFFGCLFREDPQGSPRSSPVAMDPTGLLVWLLCRLCNDADVRTDADVGTVPPRFDVFRR